MKIHMSSDSEKKGPARKRETGLTVKERARTKKPPMYKVLLHNDDYTTKEFVVMILQSIFNKSEAEAVRIMMHVHNNGIGVAGIYTHEVAETKVVKTMNLAQAHEYPLQSRTTSYSATRRGRRTRPAPRILDPGAPAPGHARRRFGGAHPSPLRR
jgi:ATP-dependent Clp protease adaptor protein ClpS